LNLYQTTPITSTRHSPPIAPHAAYHSASFSVAPTVERRSNSGFSPTFAGLSQ
jgi:hypothetical protein